MTIIFPANRPDRQGVAIVPLTAIFACLAVLAAISVDLAYMQLVKTELQVASDAGAKAALETLYRTNNQTQARKAGRDMMERFKVGGKMYDADLSDVVLGRSVPNQSGAYVFTAGATPFNAVQVTGDITQGSTAGPASLFFGGVTGHEKFGTTLSSTATFQMYEVCLCLDRSGSMLFDMTGVDYAYPPNNPLLSSFTAWGEVWRNHLSAPNPVGSRWAALNSAVEVFLDEAGGASSPPRTSLVTWASDYTMPVTPYTEYEASSVDYVLPANGYHDWDSNAYAIQTKMNYLSSHPMMGGTNISAGIMDAVAQLTGANAHPLANKSIILLTDGLWTDGPDPMGAAQVAADAGIVINTISLLSTADPELMADIAELTGGVTFKATSQEELEQVFRELARSLPVVLSE